MVSKRSHSSSSDNNSPSPVEQSRPKEGEQNTSSPLERRSLLKLLGISAIPFAIGSASAQESGYGAGGYGQDGYGENSSSDTQEPLNSLEVTTRSATNVTASEVTLTGAVSGGDAATVDCFFEWRVSGTTTWIKTEKQSLSSSNSFTHTVTDLNPDTEYEFRAVAETAHETVKGGMLTVRTDRNVSLENTILIDGTGTSGGSTYEFAVSGTVESSTYKGASIDDDVINDGHVTGSVAGWRDAFRFSGDLESLTVDGQARVYVNDERVDPTVYGGEQTSILTIVGNGTSSKYELTVDDHLKVLDGDDVTVVDASAEGMIQRGVHRFQFSGNLVELTFNEGGTQVYLDGQRIDPDDYNGGTNLPHSIVFDGTDATGPSRYSFVVDGNVTSATYRGATIDTGDSVNGSTVRGDVAAGTVDAYWFDGEIDDFWLAGDAVVDIEYNAR